MLDNAVAGFLDEVTEREFDEPLLALLRANGFVDIHYLHGSYEFGKDVIAKGERDGVRTQFVIQSKAGDLNLGGWTSIAGQLDLLRNDTHAHPNFNTVLPHQAVLVLTGRLIGGAALAAQDYAERALEKGETPFEVWDRERLTELLLHSPDSIFAGSGGGPFLSLVAAIDDASVNEDQLETFSRFWLRSGEVPQPRSTVEAAIVATQLAHTGRRDLAAIAALCLLRAVWASVHGADPVPAAALELADSAQRMFLAYAEEIWTDALAQKADDDDLSALNASGGYYSTYRVTSLRLLEILSLFALADESRRDDLADWLRRFIETNPGASQPLSDRWAVSLIPATVVLAGQSREEAARYLGWVTAWVCDHYEDEGIGLAAADADPAAEIEYFFGGSLEHVTRPRRLSSYLATVVLDLAAALELKALYEDARNDFLASDVSLSVPMPRDDDGQYQVARADIPIDTSPKYAEKWIDGDDWRMSSHHDDDLSRYYLGRIGRVWDFAAICSVTRDRHWVAAIRALAAQGGA
jgi:Restriction endonuclease